MPNYLILYSCFCFVLNPAIGVGVVSIHPKVNFDNSLDSRLPEEYKSSRLVCFQTETFWPNRKCGQSFRSQHEGIAKYDLDSEKVDTYVYVSSYSMIPIMG